MEKLSDADQGYAALREADLKHLWHPFTRIDALEKQDFPIIVRGEGVWLHDADGRAWLDGISSWWCVNLGHGNPALVAAIREQAGELQHSILGGMSHANAARLASELAGSVPGDLDRVYFCGDGAAATEAAMRMAIEYWYHSGRPEKRGMIALADGYHGDTLGAVGVGYVEAFHAPLRHVLNRALQADAPHCFVCPWRTNCELQCFDSMQRLVERHHAETAAVILEPLCQGAAGMRIYPAEYLRRLRALCDAYDVLWIADEIAVGFGRTGRLFACEHADVVPDLMCVGKGLTGGCLPMSAAIARPGIYDAFRDNDQGRPRTFYHGHTFGGNPIAAAVALAALEIYRRPDFLVSVDERALQLAEGVSRLGSMPCVADHRTLGMMSALRLREGAAQARRVAERALERGLLLRPLGDILYLWPPLVTNCEELALMFERFEAALDGE